MDSKETRLTLMEEVLLLGLKEPNPFTLITYISLSEDARNRKGNIMFL